MEFIYEGTIKVKEHVIFLGELFKERIGSSVPLGFLARRKSS